MKLSIFFIGLFWFVSLIINISGFMMYKDLSPYTVFFFISAALIFILSSFLIRDRAVNNYGTEYFQHDLNLSKLKIVFFHVIPFVILVFSVFKSAMLVTPFSEYFLMRRGGEIDGGGLVSGIGLVDTLLKIYVYPSLVSVFFVQVASIHTKNVVNYQQMFFVISQLFIYTYLFQVNYPVFLVIIVLFFLFLNKRLDALSPINRNKKKLTLLILIFIGVVFLSAANRFGSFDIFGIVMYYPLSYFSLGISIFDLNFQNQLSLIHDHTFGLNLLGHLTLPLKYYFEIFLSDPKYFTPISIENITYLNEKINIGSGTPKYVNAFGTIFFSIYRDFGSAGVMLSPVLFVALIYYYHIKNTLFSISCYYLFLFNGISALSVSPLDQPHFMFVFIFIFLMVKDLKWKKS
ncbi:hypothetical protein M2366_001471 [Aeromonas sp. BIGb0405]|uniref:O-antigen polymerase n=1 Tax=Aeromonas sp. BIGb0405 TaxID=2940592 RepID=UPI002169CEC8|nr:O-antigen polymerase [Aeromonas sp. BIGb0405]MCS3455404.1 hypothetical protein [Aeromonas sp. BIGb0405]